MATTFKSLGSSDVTTTRTLLHESIPVTGSIVSGTYGGTGVALGSEPHIKTYSHGMFQSVFDYPHLSSSANHIFDITAGYASTSAMSGASSTQNAKKINIYNQMAQVLMGYDETGSVRLFDADGDTTGGTKIKECYFLNFSRVLTKDEVKKGTFQLELGSVSAFAQGNLFDKRIRVTDTSGSDGYFVNSPAGEYGVLFAETIRDGDATLSTALLQSETITSNASVANTRPACGLIFYQAGVVVLSGSTFNDAALGGILDTSDNDAMEMISAAAATHNGFQIMTGSTIDVMASALRNRIYNVQFNNTTELNSTIYFCRANNTEFNYSANPTYLSTSGGPSEIVVKDATAGNDPISYITSVGLYSPDNELLAVAKVSEPLKKDPSNELTLRVRLDY
ncbi:MAG: hypothetical protein CMM25_08820 [Rhodospirillaceae bacterium]|nr:hypothetical protein [Rhodospirillaceae bacterium]